MKPMLRNTLLCFIVAAIALFVWEKQRATPAGDGKPAERTQPATQPAAEPKSAAAPVSQPPSQPIAAPDKPAEGKVVWFAGRLDKALAEAKSSNRLVFADFNAIWCSFCMKMKREVFATDEAATALEPVICVSIDYDKQRDTADRYLVGKELPVMIWFNPDGTVRERIDGSQEKARFLADTERIKADIGTINHERRKVEAHPEDLDERYELYRRLLAVGNRDEAAAQRAEIEKADPQGNSRPMHHLKYDGLMEAIHAHWEEAKELDQKQIEGLRNFLEVESDPGIQWDGWMSMANTYQYYGAQAQSRGESVEAKKQRSIQRDYLRRAWRGIPQDDDTLHEYVTHYAGDFWDLRDELSADDKALLLEMTTLAAHRFDADALTQDLYARALFLQGKPDLAQSACERAIELAKKSGLDPQNFEQTLALIRAGK
jgi:thiol-disulfide isomerase/thioredoxin